MSKARLINPMQYYAVEMRPREAGNDASQDADRVLVGASLTAARARARELAAKHRDKAVLLLDQNNRLVSY